MSIVYSTTGITDEQKITTSKKMSENDETEILTEHTDQWREAQGST